MKADEQEVRTMKVQIRAHEKAIRSHEKAIERIELQFERRLMRKYMPGWKPLPPLPARKPRKANAARKRKAA